MTLSDLSYSSINHTLRILMEKNTGPCNHGRFSRQGTEECNNISEKRWNMCECPFMAVWIVALISREHFLLLVCAFFVCLDILRDENEHVFQFSLVFCLFQTKQSQSLQVFHDQSQGWEEVFVWTDGPRSCSFSPLLIFDPPQPIRMVVVTATWTLDPSARRAGDSQTERRDFLSICNLLQSLPSGSRHCVMDFFIGFVKSYGLWVSLNFKTCETNLERNIWSAHTLTHSRTCHLFNCVHIRVMVCMCVRMGGCNTAQRWHFRHLLNNSK